LYCTDFKIRLSYKIPFDCSTFQSEVFAIRKAAEVAQNKNRPHDVVNLFVVSQAAIRLMQSSTVSSKDSYWIASARQSLCGSIGLPATRASIATRQLTFLQRRA